MDIFTLLESASSIGLTAPAVVGLGILHQINKKFNHFDVRLSVVESVQLRRKDD